MSEYLKRFLKIVPPMQNLFILSVTEAKNEYYDYDATMTTVTNWTDQLFILLSNICLLDEKILHKLNNFSETVKQGFYLWSNRCETMELLFAVLKYGTVFNQWSILIIIGSKSK